MDVDAFEVFLRSGGRQADERTPNDTSLPVLGDDRVAFSYLLLDREADDREGIEDLGHRPLEVLAGRALSGKQAAIGEIRAEQFVDHV